ncbi:MAG: hypothetical protein H0U72_10425 [Nitrosospira sp.]|nr:hypothetical protein [Nitrosospira sp.]
MKTTELEKTLRRIDGQLNQAGHIFNTASIHANHLAMQKSARKIELSQQSALATLRELNHV